MAGVGLVLGDVAGVVVLDLVVVPEHHPGERRGGPPGGRGRACTGRSGSGTGRAWRTLGPVVAAQRRWPPRACRLRRARRCSRRGRRPGRGLVRPGGGRRRSSPTRSPGSWPPERERVGLAVGRGQGAGAADGADVVADREPVPVVGGRRRGPSASTCTEWPSAGGRDRVPLGHDLVERLVGRDLPAHRDVVGGHAAVAVERRRASRVHRITRSWSGSPDATPSVNGATGGRGWGATAVVVVDASVVADSSRTTRVVGRAGGERVVAASAARNRRREADGD